MSILKDSPIDGYKVTTQRINFMGVSVPAGFHTDGYSIPIFNCLKWKKPTPAVVHDWVYAYPDGRTRKECDIIFLQCMKAYGVGFLKRHVYYWAVRIGGSSAWNESRADDANEEVLQN